MNIVASRPTAPLSSTRAALPLAIDNTMVTSFRSCPRKFYYPFVLNKIPHGTSVHLTAGGALAAGVNAARNAQYAADHQLSIDQLLEAALVPFLREWPADFDAPEGEAKNWHNVFHAMEEYLRQYHPWTDLVQPLRGPDGRPSTEYTFAIPIPEVLHPSGDPFIYCGRFDMLGTYAGLHVIVDEKTTGSLSASWLKQWQLRSQFLGYCWACQQHGYTVNDVIVRGIAIQKTQHQFLPAPIHYGQHLIERWYDQLLITLADIVKCWNDNQWRYDLGDSCASYGGCDYARDVCTQRDPEEWLGALADRTWSPLQLKEPR